ncbi:MAG: hypothetical protein EON55_26250 [Alphaproteobacteria bacterium]|nr:MAG: hypothetical protein EON55_26250 [Alphaproteobacteria bacterium]
MARHGVSLRLGRLFLRTWPPYRLQLPAGYNSPFLVYLVERVDEQDNNVGQVGGFTTLEAAQECVAQLESEGRSSLYVNQVAIHERVADWHDNR